MRTKKFLTAILSTILVATVCVSASGCRLFNEFKEAFDEIEAEKQAIFNQVNQIPKSDDFALVSHRQYVTSDNTIDFSALVKAKIAQDGKEINAERFSFAHYEGNISHFLFRYKEEKRVLGLNDKNNHYAVGTISTIDFSISIQYFQSEYESLESQALSETHHYYKLEDSDKKNDEYKVGYLTIDRNNGTVQEWENRESALEFIGEQIPSYSHPKIFERDETKYLVNDKRIYRKNEQGENEQILSAPTYEEAFEKCAELRSVAEILGESEHGHYIEGNFLTNGEDLFVVFTSRFGMFGYQGKLRFPIVFKCDLSLEHFEYVGCINTHYDSVEIRRI